MTFEQLLIPSDNSAEDFANRLDAEIDAYDCEIRSYLDRIDKCRQQIRTLHGQRNELCSHPRNLPPEILREIFRILVDRSLSNGVSPPSLEWTAVTHVCRFWREVALDSPQLWTNFHGGLPDAWTAEMLRRTKGLPVSLAHPPGARSNYALDAVLKIPQRIKALHLWSVKDLPSHLDKYTPLLEHLSLHDSMCCPPDLFRGLAPCLHTITLSSCRVYLEVPWSSSLRSLNLTGNWKELDFRDDKVIPTSMLRILDVLRAVPNLQVLSLTFPANDPQPNGGSIGVEPVHLSRLQDITFSSPHPFKAYNTSWFIIFNHIIPRSVRALQIDIGFSTPHTDASIIIHAACRFYKSYSCCPRPQKFQYGFQVRLREVTPPNEDAACYLLFSSLPRFEEEFWVSVLPLLPIGNIRILELSSNLMKRQRVIIPLLYSGTLEEIHLSCMERLRNVLVMEPIFGGSIRYPSLRRIHLDGIRLSRNLIADLKRWMKRYPTVKQLVIDRCHISSKDVNSFKKLVSVIWDGNEMGRVGIRF